MPAKDNVIVRMTAEDAGAYEMWRKQAKGPEQMGDAIEKAAKKGKQHTEDLSRSVEHLAGHWIGVMGALEGLKKVAEEYYKVMKENRTAEEDATRSIDTGSAKYAKIQRLTTPHAQEQAAKRIGAQAVKARVTPQTAFDAASLLGEFGVGDEAATGGTLEELLKLQNATPSTAGDPATFSRRVLDIIRRSKKGGKVDAKSIRDVGSVMYRLTTSGAGFDDKAIDTYANVATAFQQAGFDTATAMSLTAAVTEKLDPRQAKPLLREFAKPGMQKGEAEYRKRALQLLGGTGAADYEAAARTQKETLGSRETAATTGKEFAEYEPGIVSSKQAHANLKAAMREAFGKHPVSEALSETELSLWETSAILQGEDEEYAVRSAVHRWAGGDAGFNAPEQQKFLQQILGKQPIGQQPPQKMIFEHRIKGQDGRNIPAESRAVGIQDR